MIQIDAEDNCLTVAPAGDPARFACELAADQPNWIDREDLAGPVCCFGEDTLQYGGSAGRLSPETDGCFRVRFEAPQKAVTPGQAVVCYDGDVVVGGGVIRCAEPLLEERGIRE